MKYLVMTSPDSDGVSEVFYTLLAPFESAPASLIERWNILVESSPIKVVHSNQATNLGINAIWDENSRSFSEPVDKKLLNRKSQHEETYSLLIDNEVVSIIVINDDLVDDGKLVAGFSEPVIIKSVPDDSLVDLGYLWNGTEFTAPADN